MLCTLLCLSSTLAQAGGFYHPDDIAAASSQMARASEGLTARFDERAKALRRVAVALQDYRQGLELLGDRAPATEWARLETLEKQYHREEAVLQAFADEIITDFDGVMRGGLEAALEPHPEAKRCMAEIEVPGPRVPGMRARTKPNPDCTGDDLNASLAASIDANAGLGTDIDEILSLEWPAVTVDEAPQAPVGEGVERWLQVRTLATAAAASSLKQVARQDDIMRLEVDAALEGDAPDLEALKATVAKIERTTGAARARVGSAVTTAAEGRLAKWKGAPVGWCANPADLGGCTGSDQTSELTKKLTADRKFGKLVAKALK